MQYRKDRQGDDLSILGFGCMRFTRKGKDLDLEKAEQEILAAYRAGVNYYDTAYIYPGSEVLLGKIFERNQMRDRIRIATKLPQYLCGSRAAVDRYFNEQLNRLRTDHVDYYLMHHMTDVAMWEKLQKIGITDWLEEKKKSGAIRKVGFSYHGNTENFLKVLDCYDWDMCQIQYNYLDRTSQAGEEGLKAAAAKGIPVVIMEPLRGGTLVNMLPEGAKAAMKAGHPDWSAAEWGLKWLYSQPEVTVVLSGMNSLAMVEENCRIASESEAGCFGEAERNTIEEVVRSIRAVSKVNCTGCRYCMPCPQGVDIPGTFQCYNAMFTEARGTGRKQYMQTVSFAERPSYATQCIGCGKCEAHCPQNIPVREKLKEADKALRPWYYRIGIGAARLFLYAGRRKV